MPLSIDPDQLQLYDRPGPRYTSYPTAPHFTEAFGPDDFAGELRHASGRDLSLYLHLPFCRSLCLYCGCHMMVTHRPEKIDRYLGYLEREIDLAAGMLPAGQTVRQLHWGGGTPTYLDAAQIERLMNHLHRRFHLADDAEVGIEVDPRGLTLDRMEAARRTGFNRLSLGVQDFDPQVQQAIGRVQPEALVAQAVGWARDLGFESISFDLIYGLPHQSLASFDRTLDRVLALDPDRISLFNYAHVPWLKRHQRLIPVAHLPAPEVKVRLFTRAIERLTGAGGFRYVGMDHFAKPTDSLCRAQDEGTLYRNFQGYSTHAGLDVVAFGISAISQLEWVYAQNVKDLPAYYRSIDAGRLPVARGVRLTGEDQLRRRVITRLMCDFALRRAPIEQDFGIDFDAHFAAERAALEGLEADGLIRLTPEGLDVTDLGRLLIRNVAMVFDAYLPQTAPEGRPTFSRTV